MLYDFETDKNNFKLNNTKQVSNMLISVNIDNIYKKYYTFKSFYKYFL